MDVYGYLAIGCVAFVILLFVYALIKAGSDDNRSSGYQPKNTHDGDSPSPPTTGSNIHNKNDVAK